MATYAVLFNWTDQGIKNYRESPSRVEAFSEQIGPQTGVTIKDLYWTVGPYDIIALFDAPDDESLSAALLALGAAGNVRSTSLRAFGRDEFPRILERAQ